jgi:hypothetical protein
LAFVEIFGQLLRDQKSADVVQGMNVIRGQPFDRAANASDSVSKFFYEWCAVAVFRRPTNETRLLSTSNGALLTLGVHKKRAAAR